MKIFDTHCHPNLNKDKSKESIINNFFQNSWEYMTIIGTSPEKNKQVIDIAYSDDRIFCSIWIHPCDVYDLAIEETIDCMKQQIKENKNKIVAIWECWLDYYWLGKEEWISQDEKEGKISKQHQFFKAQIQLAKKYNLPIVIHNRDSKEDVLKILKETDFKNFIFHCYSENLEYANRLIEFSPDCKISFSWIVTFKNAKEIQETAKNINIKHILAETDSPYLTPTPLRWKEENEPLYTKYVVEYICSLRWWDVSEQIFENSLNVFNIKK